ncbi:MAG: hypothetical protein IT561_00410 [Alphaproteobacteria bacterium]|nr:hypothetical protein [Alphaproteobacteria bacterium]
MPRLPPTRPLLALGILVGLATAAAAQQAPSADALLRLLGPLAPQGLVGRAGDWEMAVADDAYVLTNRVSPYGARFMSLAPPAGPLSLSAMVRIEPGAAPADALVGAGLLFDLHGAGAARRYALMLVERSGEIGLYRGDAAGLKRESGRHLPAATGFVRLALAEEGGRLVATANGIRIAETARGGAAGARAGVAAVGPGRFAFREVRMGTADPAPAAAWIPRRLGRVTLELPGDWTATQRADGMVAATGPDGARVVWWPFRRAEALSGGAARALLPAMAAAAVPDRAVGPPAAAGDGLLVAPLRDGDRDAGRAVLRTAAGGGLLAVASAPAWTADTAATAARILASLRLAGPPPAEAALRTRRWSDPAGGFSAEVPVGWTAEGGTRIGRDGTPAWHLSATSPGGARIFLGDPELPLFLLPTERLRAAGIQEGATFRHTDGTPVLVARHMPGLGYAEVHGMRILAGRCAGDPDAVHRRRRADLAEPLSRGLVPLPGSVELEAGEVAMSCTGKEGPLAAYVLAATDGDSGKDAWSVPVVLGFAAPLAEARTAVRALASLAASVAPAALATAGRDEDPARRAEGAARIAAAIGQSWWSTHAPDAGAVTAIATPADGDVRPLESGAGLPWLAAGADPGAGIRWAELLAAGPGR